MPPKRRSTGAKKREAYYYHAGKETKVKRVVKKAGTKSPKRSARKPRNR